MRPPPRAPVLAVAAIALVAAAWFWAGIRLTLEWVDQGQIVYGAWRVARGDLPYRDFDHLYGPALFFLNGALMRWFGEDLLVVRIGLLATKALLAGLLFLVCRAVARPAIALAVTGWFVLEWGVPLWIYATPYAGHYALACCLLGLAILVRRPAGRARRALAAGLCVGVGATFKHTTGLFVALGVLVVLTSLPVAAVVRDGLAGVGRALRAAAAVAAALVVVGYLSGTLDTWTGALLMTPPLLAFVIEWLRDLPRERALSAGGPRVARTLAFGIGFAVPLAAWAAVYASQGALGELVHDLLLGLPQRVDWDVPLATPHPIVLAFSAALTAAAVGLATGRTALVGLGGLATAALFAAAAFVPGWGGVGLQTMRYLPVALVWTSEPLALRRGEQEAPRLLWWFGAFVCLSLHPASDLPHALMILPAVLPLLALLVEAAWSRARAPLARAAVIALVGAPLLSRAATDVAILARVVAERPEGTGFDRARCVWDATPQFEAMRAVVARLDRMAPRGAPLLVLPSAQLLYVLTDRPSALPRAELIFYLLAIDVMSPEDARALLSDDELVARLATLRPPIVRLSDPGQARIAAAFPQLTAWIDRHYAVSDTIGGLQVLQPRGDSRSQDLPTGRSGSRRGGMGGGNVDAGHGPSVGRGTTRRWSSRRQWAAQHDATDPVAYQVREQLRRLGDVAHLGPSSLPPPVFDRHLLDVQPGDGDQRRQLDAVLEAVAPQLLERQGAAPQPLHPGVEVGGVLAIEHVEEPGDEPVAGAAEQWHGGRPPAEEARGVDHRMRPQRLDDRRDRLRGIFQIRVDDHHQLGVGGRDPVANRRAVALVAHVAQQPRPVALDARHRAVARGVVHEEESIGVAQARHAGVELVDRRFLVEHRHDDVERARHGRLGVNG